jgi:hypothetical protein
MGGKAALEDDVLGLENPEENGVGAFDDMGGKAALEDDVLGFDDPEENGVGAFVAEGLLVTVAVAVTGVISCFTSCGTRGFLVSSSFFSGVVPKWKPPGEVVAPNDKPPPVVAGASAGAVPPNEKPVEAGADGFEEESPTENPEGSTGAVLVAPETVAPPKLKPPAPIPDLPADVSLGVPPNENPEAPMLEPAPTPSGDSFFPSSSEGVCPGCGVSQAPHFT